VPTPAAARNVLWLDDCDPRQAPDFCPGYQSLEPLQAFYQMLDSVGASLTYRLPGSLAELAAYDVIVANFCSSAGNLLELLRQYIYNGGSVIVMGDEFCLGVPPNGGSSGATATLLTEEFGIRFGVADDNSEIWAVPAMEHPISQGIDRVHAGPRAELEVVPPSQTVFSVGDRPFIAIYDGVGTIVAVPRIGFHWDMVEPDSQNLPFWQLLMQWLAASSQVKRNPDLTNPIVPPEWDSPLEPPSPFPFPTPTPFDQMFTYTPTPWLDGTSTPLPLP